MLEDAKLIDKDMDGATGAKAWGTRLSAGGEAFATSLFWQPLQNIEDPRAEVMESGTSILEGADLFCLKKGKSPQFGICVAAEGYSTGMPSAAAALASAWEDLTSFVGVFKVPEGWWYVCVRNDIILSDGDMLFLNEEDARTQLMSMLTVPDWNRRAAPAEWGLEDTEQPDLAQALGRGARSKLEKIHTVRGPKLYAAVAAAGAVGLWIMYSIVDALFFSPSKTPITAPVLTVLPKPAEEPPPEPKPWETVPDPAAIMRGCYKALTDLIGIMPPGWKLQPPSCSKAGAEASWARQVGRIAWASQAMDESGLDLSWRNVSDDGNLYQAALPLGEEVKMQNSPPLIKMADLRHTLNDLFQAIGADGSVMLTNGSITTPQNAVYRQLKFSIKSDQNPLIWLDLLIKFSGLEIYSVTYNNTNNLWEYEGAIYAL